MKRTFTFARNELETIKKAVQVGMVAIDWHIYDLEQIGVSDNNKKTPEWKQALEHLRGDYQRLDTVARHIQKRINDEPGELSVKFRRRNN